MIMAPPTAVKIVTDSPSNATPSSAPTTGCTVRNTAARGASTRSSAQFHTRYASAVMITPRESIPITDVVVHVGRAPPHHSTAARGASAAAPHAIDRPAHGGDA